ncbi:MAG TPA: MarR family transcriptional regulator [Candidatus Dormibacteraeota bacterium]|nr:MarR family transcriptional regulator [Candidatus Dormibacteraeota bacterium]
MNVGHPYRDVIPGARGDILAALVRLARPVTIRELGRLAGVSSGRASAVVDQLAQAGLVHREAAGRAILVTLNSDHLAADGIRSLINLRATAIARLVSDLRGWRGLAAAWLYGSTARGDGDAGSDVDILLVGLSDIEAEWWAEQVGRLSSNVERWTGNVAQLSEHTLGSFRQLVTDGNPLIAALRSDGIELTDGAARILGKLSAQ